MRLSPPAPASAPGPGRAALALYLAAATVAEPALRLLLRARLRRGRELPDRLGERRGLDAGPRPPGPLLWLHAASVGETASVLPVVAALPPAVTVLLTTGTVTAAALVGLRRAEMGLDRLVHRFVPLDVPRWVARFLDGWRPDAAAFVESELWPAAITACRRRGVPLALLNARMSVRSARGWGRAPGLARMLLGSFALLEAQSAADAARLRALGAPAVATPGNLKFAAADLPFDPAELDRLRALLGGRPVWLAASTHEGEEHLVLEAHRRLAAIRPGLVTVIAPRHPGRGEALARALSDGAPLPRRSLGQDPPPGGLWLADTLGELGLLYRLCPAALVGNSLLPPGGGHNPLEPARAGCAVATGPHAASFEEALATLRGAGALGEVADAPALAAWVDATLRDDAARARTTSAAREIAGAQDRLPAAVAARLCGLLGVGAR